MNSDTAGSTLASTGMGTGSTGTTGSTGSMGSTGSSTSSTGGSGSGSSAMSAESVQRMADKAHAAVDTLAQTLGSSTDKMMGWQQEYGDMAREQVRANPLAVVAGAFAVGWLFAKITR